MKRELADGTVIDLTQEEVAALAAENQASVNRVPPSISRLRVIEQAEAEGQWAALKAALQAHPTAWDKFLAADYAARDHALVAAMGAVMSKDAAAMDQFFRDASKR